MTEKFRIVHLRENPINTKRKVGRRRKRAPAPRRRAAVICLKRNPKRRKKKAPTVRRKGFIVEALKEARGRVAFVFWTGGGFSASRRAAKIFRTEKEAFKAAHRSIKRRPATYRLARVVPA